MPRKLQLGVLEATEGEDGCFGDWDAGTVQAGHPSYHPTRLTSWLSAKAVAQGQMEKTHNQSWALCLCPSVYKGDTGL